MIDRLREVVRIVSGREREVLGHIARGATYREIARRMDVSPHTVDTYMRRIRAKTGARNRMHLLLLALSVEGSLVNAIEDMGLSPTPKSPGRSRV
ncbi:response regulator transcription factor [Streptomyces tagetis]|uniref:response regulator transcription factor n=1 Tax=Streptomyces tagetis TaxID=2820809 RepID=UPI001FFA40A0|nr:helix-turn-helix transcriptional regulator [Streptomyces sp. RG38]